MEQAMTLEAQPDTSPRRGDRRKERSVTTRADLERAAHRYLQRYETTQAHLRTVLERRARRGQKASSAEGEPSAPIGHWIEEIVARCVEMRLVDDGRFAEGMVRRLHRQGASHRASWQKLRQKGVPEGLIAEQLGSAPDEQRELHAACLLARKRRLGPWRDAAERPERRERDLAALGRAGFSFAIAARIIDAASPDELPEARTVLPPGP